MRKIKFTFVIAAFLTLGALGTFAQSPQAFKYQAIARDITGNVLQNQSISIRITILSGSPTGTPEYVETHSDTTNRFGLFNLQIGNGTLESGNFTTIDWGLTSHYIKIEMDETGGTAYQLMGTSQLLSVPYALHAKTAEAVTETDPVFGSSVANSITAADTANWNNHTIDTDTQLDSTGVASLGFAAGAHTIDTDTQLDSAGVATLGYAAGAHTVDTDTQLDSAGVTSLGFAAGAHTIDTDTQLDSTGVAILGYVAGTHTIDTQLDSTGVTSLGFVAGAHTIEVDADSTNELQAIFHLK